jgi:hypothetical protein
MANASLGRAKCIRGPSRGSALACLQDARRIRSDSAHGFSSDILFRIQQPSPNRWLESLDQRRQFVCRGLELVDELLEVERVVVATVPSGDHQAGQFTAAGIGLRY